MLFIAGLHSDVTIVHEIGHSFQLQHLYTYKKYSPLYTHKDSPYLFYQGYTENYLDNYKQDSGDSNKYEGKRYSFFKWQWDIMREDKSLKY